MPSIALERISELTDERRRRIMTRSMEDVSSVFEDMRAVVRDIADRGDQVSLDHYQKYKDGITVEDLVVGEAETKAAYEKVSSEVVDSLQQAKANIEKFHLAQKGKELWAMEVSPGILAGRIERPLDCVGCYVPGRQAAYPSSVLMTIIPARAAGVPRVVVTTPPDTGMIAHPATIVAADIAGADMVVKLGGPWAVGSLAYGTETVPRVDKIVGPGNRYVTAAKLAVFGQVDIDSPAGPSEALIVADHTANPRWVALDFLSQIEHDPDAAAVLVSTCAETAEATIQEILEGLNQAKRRDIIDPALERNSAVLLAADMDEAIAFANEYAAEHLEIVAEEPFVLLQQIRHAGSIFLGPYAPVPAGDYASGTNHVLPTGQTARMFSGLSVDDFIKRPTFQYLTKEGLAGIRNAVEILAEEEGLFLHGQTIKARFES